MGKNITPTGHHFGTLTEEELSRISSLIYHRAGIVLSGQKKDMVYNRLSRRLTTLGIHRFSEYMDLLESDPSSAEWEIFINALTTNLTSFFREAYHFPILAEHARQRKGMYNVWCAAASAYPLALRWRKRWATASPARGFLPPTSTHVCYITPSRGCAPVRISTHCLSHSEKSGSCGVPGRIVTR